MSINIVSTPNKIINGLDSRASGALLQLPYLFQREDYQVNRIYTSGGVAVVRITAPGGTVSVGDFVYIKDLRLSVDGTPIGSSGFTVTQVDVNADQQRVWTDIPYTGIEREAFGSLNNLSTRTNYRVIIEVLDSSGAVIVDTAFRYSPDVTGRLFVDVGIIIGDYMFREGILSQVFKLRYQETWDELVTPVYNATWNTITSGTGGNVRLQNLSVDPTGVVNPGDLLYFDFTADAYPDGNYFVAAIVNATTMEIQLPFQASTFDSGTISPAQGTESKETQATFASIGAYTDLGSNLWEYLLRVGLDNSDLPIDEWQNISTGVGDWSFDGSRWRNAPITNPQISGTLAIYRDWVAKEYTWVIEYACSPAGNTSGSLDMVLIGDGAAQTTRQMPVSGSITTFEFNVTTVSSFSYIGFQLRPTATDGTNIEMNIYSITLKDGKANERGKLLTNFKNPFIWRGWKRTVSLLGDLDYSGRIGGGNIHVDFGFLNANINKQTYGSTRTIRYLNVSNNPTVFVTPVQEGDGTEDFIRTRAQLTNGSTAVSQELFYRVLPECPEPIMVEFFSSLGTLEQHLFTLTQQIEVTAEKGTLVTTPVNRDLAGDYSRRLGRRLPDYKQQLLLTAESLTLDQLLALQEITYSSEVVLYLNKDGSKTIPVILSGEPVSSYNTKDKNLYSLQITIQLPDNVRFEDIKLY